jgi:hypothetical protein
MASLKVDKALSADWMRPFARRRITQPDADKQQRWELAFSATPCEERLRDPPVSERHYANDSGMIVQFSSTYTAAYSFEGAA